MAVGNGQGYYTKKSERGEADALNFRAFGIMGAIIGLVMGGALGNKLVEDEGKEKADAAALLLQDEGLRIEKKRVDAIIETLGLHEYQSQMYKEGRYWVGLTKWVDCRLNKLYTLKTERSDTGVIRTSLNGAYIFNHIEKTATKDFIPAAHTQSRDVLFKRLVDHYQKNADITLDEMFELKQV